MRGVGVQVERSGRAEVHIKPWGESDLPLLQACLGDPLMMAHLGGPETAAKIAERQARYAQPDSKQFKIVVDAAGERVGWVGYWEREWQGDDVYEIGWLVLPAFQGRGIAGAATLEAKCSEARILRMTDYTITNLSQVEDSAAAGGLDFGSARFPRTAVGAEETGFAHITLLPGRHQPFGHRHEDAEEVYFVISGSGAIKLDDGVHELRAHDLVRLAPSVARSLRGGPDGMEILAFGARHDGDGELLADFWET